MRRQMYKFLRIMNDINALTKGKYHKRLMRKYAYKKGGGILNKLLK